MWPSQIRMKRVHQQAARKKFRLRCRRRRLDDTRARCAIGCRAGIHLRTDDARDRLESGDDLGRVFSCQTLGIDGHLPLLNLHDRSDQVELMFQQPGGVSGDIEHRANRERYLNSRSTLLTLLQLGVVPVINENDAIADDEIRFGDNDRIAALVAHLVGAEPGGTLAQVRRYRPEVGDQVRGGQQAATGVVNQFAPSGTNT